MPIRALAAASVAPALPRRLGARALVALIAMLCAACGAEADEALEEGPTEAAMPLAPAASKPARPRGAADTTASAAPTSDEAGTTLEDPSTPLAPPPVEPAPPAPLPSAALDTTRPLLPPAPAEVLIPPGECRFEFLGESVRCEHAGWPNVVETDATDLVTCMQHCLDVDACTAVTDYLWLGQPALGCYLYLSTCDEPLFVTWGEEDAGRDFRRACAGGSTAPTP